MSAMRKLRHLITVTLTVVLSAGCISASLAQHTYILRVDSIIGIPDTIYDGENITFTMVFSNSSNLGFQGDVETALYFPNAQDTITADSSVMNANFVAAQTQQSVFATHFFTSNDNNLAIGDNVVVVWPRITFGPTGPPQEVLDPKTINFYLAPPLSAPTLNRQTGILQLYPNPTHGNVRLSFPDHETLASVRITDMMGRTVLESHQVSVSLSIESLPHGIYTVHATTAKGLSYAARLVVRP